MKRNLTIKPQINFETFLLILKEANNRTMRGIRGSYLATKNIFFEDVLSSKKEDEPKQYVMHGNFRSRRLYKLKDGKDAGFNQVRASKSHEVQSKIQEKTTDRNSNQVEDFGETPINIMSINKQFMTEQYQTKSQECKQRHAPDLCAQSRP